MLWLRRDLRLHDHPALLAAAEDGPVVPLVVLDDALLRPAGTARTVFYLRTLRALDGDLREHGGRLVIRRGRPEEVVPRLVAEIGASAVHISSDHAPYGTARDERVRAALADVPLVATGSPYAVTPGSLRTQQGGPYQVFTPFYRAWTAHGWRRPAASDPGGVRWGRGASEELPDEPAHAAELDLPPAGERAALARWERFRDVAEEYARNRDRPDLAGTSALSPYLKWGSIHPRTLLADLGPEEEAFRSELAWREFFASTLAAWPRSARDYLRPELRALPSVTGRTLQERFDAWRAGRTGYPFVDAAMRQLRGTGWMHNRARMVVASFLVKDLKVEWTWGARHFMRHLVDGDLASNQLNWQWAAGTGLDAAPYVRIFNPITQGRRFDPDGGYVRRWVPELRSMSAPEIHQPWLLAGGPPDGYPEPLVDHAEERLSALAAYESLRRR